MPIDSIKMAKLKLRCGQVLRTSGINPNTKAGAKLIQMFWVGALTALGDD